MSPPDLGRYGDALDWLRASATADDDVGAVRVGGSAATRGYDAWSDPNVDVLCTPGTSPRVHERLLASPQVGRASVWRRPDATWPDGRQSLVTLDPDVGRLDAPTWILDLHVHDDDTPVAGRVDPRQHGTVLVLHDPDGGSPRCPTTRLTWSAVGWPSSSRVGCIARWLASWSPRGGTTTGCAPCGPTCQEVSPTTRSGPHLRRWMSRGPTVRC